MKQFKIIETAELSTTDTTGIITANFAMPITIEAGSSISLDKFNTKIRNDNTFINVPQQIIGIQYNFDEPEIGVTIQGNYAQKDLPSQISDELNFNVNPEGVIVAHIGLKMYWTVDATKISTIGYTTTSSSPFTDGDYQPINMSVQTDEYFIYDGGNEGEFQLTAPDEILLRGGGFELSFNVRPDLFNEPKYDWQCGLQAGTDAFALVQNHNFPGRVSIESNIGEVIYNNIINPNIFYPDDIPTPREVQIAQVNGHYTIVFSDIESGEVIETIQTSVDWQPNLYVENSLPPVPNNLTFYVQGTKTDNDTPYEEATDNPGWGEVRQTTEGGLPYTLQPRTITMTFNEAAYIQTVFDLPTSITLNPVNTDAASYSTVTPYNTTIFKSNPDIAIELLDLALESYASGLGSSNNTITGLRQPGARCNVLAYFTPLESTTNKTFYSYAQSSYQFLSLANKSAITFTSLSFRIFSPSTGQPLLADEISFNFLVKDPGE